MLLSETGSLLPPLVEGSGCEDDLESLVVAVNFLLPICDPFDEIFVVFAKLPPLLALVALDTPPPPATVPAFTLVGSIFFANGPPTLALTTLPAFPATADLDAPAVPPTAFLAAAAFAANGPFILALGAILPFPALALVPSAPPLAFLPTDFVLNFPSDFT